MNPVITIRDVAYVAHLARIALSEEDAAGFTRDLDRILGYVSQISQLDVRDVPPTTHVVPVKNIFREDVVRPSLPREEALASAPDSKEGAFRVPSVIE